MGKHKEVLNLLEVPLHGSPGECFQIYFDDLTEECQKRLTKFMGEGQEEFNWEIVALADVPFPELD